MTNRPDPDAPARRDGQLWRVATLSSRKPTRVAWRPDARARAALAQELGLLDLAKLELVGEIRPEGRQDFTLTARLVAEASQPCAITLVPVPAHVAEDVTRRYLADYTDPDGDEVEMDADDTIEPLPEAIDLCAIAAEALMLALPAYPRAPGAELSVAQFAPPGAAPLRDEDMRPFAGLAALKSRLAENDGEG